MEKKMYHQQRIFTAFIFALLLFAGCKQQDTVITGHISGVLKDSLLFITRPIYGTCHLAFADTLYVDADGAFTWKIKLQEPVLVRLQIYNAKRSYTLQLDPGGEYRLEMDVEKGLQQISGPNEKGLMLYASFPNPYYLNAVDGPYMKDTSLLSIHEKIEKLQQDEMAKWKDLADKQEISSTFVKLSQTERNFYYSAMESYPYLSQLYNSANDERKAALIELLDSIYAQYPPSDESLIISYYWPDYANSYINYQIFTQPDFNRDSIMAFRSKGFFHTWMFGEAQKRLKGKTLEYYTAYYLFDAAFQQKYDKELIDLFDKFKKDYPRSEYTRYIQPQIDKIVQYHQTISQPFEQAMFLENYESINTLQDALKPLRGKKVYVDVWATWCGPCKAEFRHNEELKEILAKDDIQKLYISIDRKEDHQQWLDNIKYFKMEGYHVHANKALFLHLEQCYSKDESKKYISIPWYLLADEEGNILNDRAKEPSKLVKGENLFK